MKHSQSSIKIKFLELNFYRYNKIHYIVRRIIMATNEMSKGDITQITLQHTESTFNMDEVSYGVQYIAGGYVEFAQEVITNRALPNIFDGLKPVQRRIVVTLRDAKAKGFVKCGTLAGKTMELHPHGDSAIYQAMVLMTDSNGSMAFPLFNGQGNFGAVDTDDPAAASRYTEIRFHQNIDEYFGEMDGIDMIPNFDSTKVEPELLPVSFPAVLVNAVSGVAVGFKCNIPSFNFTDVCNLVKEYIEKGKCETVIAPDFVTGGYYINNERELKKLMLTGEAKLKLRGKAVIEDKKIQITEIPYGKTIQNILKQINDKNIPSIRNAYDTDDFDHNTRFTVDCVNKNRVDEALYALYKDTNFQYTFPAQINVIKNGVPVAIGVWKIIEEWVAWRKTVLTKAYTKRKHSCEARMAESKAVMAVVNSPKKDDFVKIVTTQGKDAGKQFIKSNWTREEIPEDLIDFASNRAISIYHKGGKYAEDYAQALKELEALNNALNDLDKVISNQMDRLINTYGHKMPRKTEITHTDYEFTEKEKDKEEAKRTVDTTKVFYSFKNNFIKKTAYADPDKDIQIQFSGIASDTLIAFDNRGRLIRIYGEDLPMYGYQDLGCYIPRYCNLTETDDYKILWVGKMEGQKLLLMYKDGNIGLVDTNEWNESGRRVKVLERGISKISASTLGAVIDTKETLPYVMVSDNLGRVGVYNLSEMKQKDRTARTRAVTISRDAQLDSYAFFENEFMLNMTLTNYQNYLGRMVKLKQDDFIGSADVFKVMF